jgi:hypothetical protein
LYEIETPGYLGELTTVKPVGAGGKDAALAAAPNNGKIDNVRWLNRIMN